MRTAERIAPADHVCLQPSNARPVQASRANSSRRSLLATRRLHDALVVVDLDPSPAFAVAWLTLFLAHSLCIAFLLGTISALRLLADPMMAFYADLLRSNLTPLYDMGVLLLRLLVFLHVLQLVLMLLASVRERRFQLTSFTAECLRMIHHRQRRDARESHLLGHTRRIWRFLFGRRGLFGVDSPHYEWRYAASEAVEIVSLSLQAYSSSIHLDPKRWLIDLYVACAVFNCWSTPIVMNAMSKSYSHAARRLACVVLDAVLDSGTAMVFPLVLVVPYIRAFDPTRHSFDTNLLYNDVWFINFINENRQIFPVSGLDLVVKLIPHASVFMSLKTIRSIIRAREPSCKKSTTVVHDLKSVKIPVARGETLTEASITPLPANRNGSKRVSKGPSRSNFEFRRHEVFRIVYVDRCYIIFALFLLACHLSSRLTKIPTDGQCKLPLRPWFVRKSACSLYMFNCFRRHVDSVEADDLAFLHRASLAVVVFAHCPALRVTQEIHDFPNLFGLEIYNSSLVAWGSEAAISARIHPALSYVFIVRTNMTEIPLGMRGLDLPSTLMDIEFSVTNLSSVPDDLDVVWSGVYSVYIEYSQLTVIPDVFLRMALGDVSFIGNQIDDVSIVLFLSDSLMLGLARNPIRSLPTNFSKVVSSNTILNLVDTGIAELSDELIAAISATGSVVFMHGTPFCDALSVEEQSESYDRGASITCELTNERLRGRYPLSVTAPLWRP